MPAATSEAPSLYAPVSSTGRVELSRDHPGFADPDYRRRRDGLASLAHGWVVGMPVPHAAYTPPEHQVWSTVSQHLAPLHERFAARCIRDAIPRVALPSDHVPQLEEVSAALHPISGYRYGVVPGLASLREFYGSLADDVFLSTQYLRHPSVPLYTPEPDVIHEVVGHALSLAVPELAELCRATGRAVRRLQTQPALELVSRVFWFTLEFGLVREGGELRTYGAGILSSFGELQSFRDMDIRPLDIAAMVATPYDITHYQPVLFAAESLPQLCDVLGGFLDTVDDESPAALSH
jgi:phenylalanine-4-hydroxylase